MTDVTELFGEVVKKASEDLQILYPDGKGEFVTIKNPDLNYIFGNSQLIFDISKINWTLIVNRHPSLRENSL